MSGLVFLSIRAPVSLSSFFPHPLTATFLLLPTASVTGSCPPNKTHLILSANNSCENEPSGKAVIEILNYCGPDKVCL